MRILVHCAILLGLCYLTLVAIDQLMHTHPIVVFAIMLISAGYSVFVYSRHIVPLERDGHARTRPNDVRSPTTIPAE